MLFKIAIRLNDTENQESILIGLLDILTVVTMMTAVLVAAAVIRKCLQLNFNYPVFTKNVLSFF
ncbi:MAG TPA: hypothetical protein DCR60_01385 [Psychrobacter sp.]|nr:hypothetical protein [Psychrobacter sp.]